MRTRGGQHAEAAAHSAVSGARRRDREGEAGLRKAGVAQVELFRQHEHAGGDTLSRQAQKR